MTTSQQEIPLPVIQFDINDFMAHQQQHERAHPMPPPEPMHQSRQMQETEPIVGGPLFGVSNTLVAPSLLHPLNPWNPLGLGGLPGMRFSNFQAGHLGGLHFGNAMLGAGNPMEAAEDAQVGGKHKHKHHRYIEQQVGYPQRLEMQPMEAENQVGMPQNQEQGFYKGFGWPWLHWAEEVGATNVPTQEFELTAPPMQQYGAEAYAFQPMPAQEFQVAAPMQLQAPEQNYQMIPQQIDEGARTWGKGYYKGHNNNYE